MDSFESTGNFSPLNLLGSSPIFRQACMLIQKFAQVDATVLIEGETGTGKEVAARAMHYLSKRKGNPFIPVNCGALPETLIESELFGHERGAFTDAKAASPGLVSEANGGTLFLDEVDALSLKAQAAILRFIQDKSYRRVGSGITRTADVRIIVASNAKLEQLVESRHFRRDLLYRLNVLVLRMPSLRDREGDVQELAEAFLTRLSHQYRLPAKKLHPDAFRTMREYQWPGNVRELENIVHREFLMCEGEEVQLPLHGSMQQTSHGEQHYDFKSAKSRAVSEFERRYVNDMLMRSDGNLSLAARLSGQDRSAFGKLARKHNIDSASVKKTAKLTE